MNDFISESRCIRIFRTRKQAEIAQRLLEAEGFSCYVTEDGFEELTLEELNIPPRFRLYVAMQDVKRIAKFLSGKLPKRVR